MPVKREAESEMSVATRDLERYQAMSERLGLKVDHPWTYEVWVNHINILLDCCYHGSTVKNPLIGQPLD